MLDTNPSDSHQHTRAVAAPPGKPDDQTPWASTSRICTSLTPSPPALGTGKDGCYLTGDFLLLFSMSGFIPLSSGEEIAGGTGVIPSFQSTFGFNRASCDT